MPIFSKQTKSFIALFLLAFILVMSSYYILTILEQKRLVIYYVHRTRMENAHSQTHERYNSTKGVDTSDWLTYSDETTGLSFRYPKDWDVKEYEQVPPEGYSIIGLDPGRYKDNVWIYVSNSDFYGLEGIPTSQTEIAGEPALTADDLIYGVKHNSTYYTFDLGGNVRYKPEFKALIDQVAFR